MEQNAAVQTLLMQVNRYPASFQSQNMDSSVLDLTIRKRPISPEFSYSYPSSKHEPIYIQPSNASVCSSNSPKSESENSETSATSDYASYTSSTKIKPARPFKAYPKDPISLALNAALPETILGRDSMASYAQFRHKMLSQVQNNNGTNKNMRRNSQSANAENGDPTYWERRRKNNEAAKRSRDARRAKEDEIAIRCAFLEQENMQLKFRIANLENEMERMQHIYR